MRTKRLFRKADLRRYIKHKEEELMKEIESYNSNKLLNTSIEDLTNYFVEKYSISPIEILEDEIYVDQEETEVDVRNDKLILADYITGTKITLHIPFKGDAELFKYKPSQFTLNPPRGKVRDNLVLISVSVTEHDTESVQKELDNRLNDIKKYIENVKDDIKPWNKSLYKKAKNKIEKRRKKLLKDRKLAANLEFPLKEREDNYKTYVAPEIRKKSPKPPKVETDSYEPEPVLAMEDYEHILELICQTAKTLERSPETFKDMGEEQLRDQFLVPLNSHYEGQASGETFNRNGKTDILIRVKDKNIFIAECKIWRGPKAFSKAIDQLLNYTTWRDTKIAIIIFNRNKNLTNVLNKIPNTVSDHPNCKTKKEYNKETGFRYVFGHPDDSNRELHLTILVFDVPN